jgi:uncharacterized PurR-regulated membrane protein YhhQ (DUF165 family)
VLACAAVSALHIAELIIAQEFTGHDDSCNNNTLMTPITWLKIGGIVGIVCSIFIVLHIVCKSFYKNDALKRIVALSLVFNLIWMIMGWVVLLRDNSHCMPDTLYNMMLASCIIRLILELGGGYSESK